MMKTKTLIFLIFFAAIPIGCSKETKQAKRVDGYIQDLEDGPNAKRIAACQELAQMGPAAEPAVPALIKVMVNSATIYDPVGIAASSAIEKVGPAALPYLEKANKEYQRWTLEKLIADIKGQEYVP